MADYDLGTARGRIEIDASTLGRTSAALDKFGKGLLGIGAVALAGFGVAVGAAASFEKTMSGVEAVLGPQVQGKMDALREKTLQLGKDTIFSSKEVAEGMEAMAKAGLTADEMLNGAAEATVTLAAAAGNMQLDRAAEIASNAMRMFQLPAEDMVKVADVLAGAANSSTVEVEDLAVSLKYAGSVANAMGMSFEEVNTALAILGDRGIKGSTAGTSLRGVLLSLTGTSGPAKAALKELGIITEDGSNKFFDAAGNMKSMAEIAQVLQDATKGLSEEQRAAAFNTIFQRRAMSSAIILADQGAKGFDEYAKAIGRVSAADVASKKLDNLAGDFEILKGSIETLVIQFGQTFQETLRGWTQAITGVVNWLASLDRGTQKMIMQALLIIGVLATVTGGFVLFMSAMVKTYRAFRDLQRGIKLITGAMKLLNLSFVTNPVFLVIAGLVALGAALFILYKKSETFRKFVDKLWQTLQGLWDDISGAGVKAWHLMQQGFDMIMGAVKAVVNFIKNNWDLGLLLLGPIGAVIVVWRRFGDDIVRIISGAITAVINFFKALPGNIVSIFLSVVTAAANFALQLGSSLINGISSAIESFKEFMSKLPYWIGYYTGLALGTLIRWTIEAVQAIVKFGVDFIQAYVNFWMELPGKAWEFLQLVIEKIGEFAATAIAKIIEFGATVIERNIYFWSQLPGRIWGFLTQVISNLATFVSQGIAKAIEFASGVLNKVVEFLSQLPGKAAEFFTNVVSAIRDKILGAGQAARELGVRIFDTIDNAIRGLPGLITGVFGRLVSAIKDKIGDAFNAVKNLASGMWEGFKKGLFGSPRTKIEYAVEDMTATVDREINNLAGQIRTLQRMGNSFADINPQATFGIAQGSGITSRPSTPAVAAPGAATTPREGDVIHITGADTKTAMEISREIIFEKRALIPA